MIHFEFRYVIYIIKKYFYFLILHSYPRNNAVYKNGKTVGVVNEGCVYSITSIKIVEIIEFVDG